MIYCKHYDCQCARAAELMWMSDATGRADLMGYAVEIHKHNLEVRCIHMPRDPRVPFSEKGGQHVGGSQDEVGAGRG